MDTLSETTPLQTPAEPTRSTEPASTDRPSPCGRGDLIALRVWLVCCFLMWLMGLFNLFAGAWSR